MLAPCYPRPGWKDAVRAAAVGSAWLRWSGDQFWPVVIVAKGTFWLRSAPVVERRKKKNDSGVRRVEGQEGVARGGCRRAEGGDAKWP